MKVAIVGVTGLVGKMMLKVMEERKFPATDLIPVASDLSTDKEISFFKRKYRVVNLEEGMHRNPDLVLFSAGKELSLKHAPHFTNNGAVVIDNSSAWRMDPEIQLIIPEINGESLSEQDKLIANPNCSTIQMVMVLWPLHRKFDIKRIIVSTYQAVSGTGSDAIKQLENERAGAKGVMTYPHPIDGNCIPHCDTFDEDGYTGEEMKLVNETRKIMKAEHLKITATAVRVPVFRGHSESVNVEFHKAFTLDDIRNLLVHTTGVTLTDEPLRNRYPMPLHSKDNDEVMVGRIRRDFSADHSLNLWIVADNLRKGAATNAVQIAEYLLRKNWL
jgi:aspartate-semialdehyde dehydrogenase